MSSSPKVNQFVNSFQSFLKVLVSSNELTQNLMRKVEIMLFYLNRFPLDCNKMEQYCQNCGCNEFQQKFEKDNQLDILIFGVKNILSKGSFLEQPQEVVLNKERSHSQQILPQYLELPSTLYMTQSNNNLNSNLTPIKQQEINNYQDEQQQLASINNSFTQIHKESENQVLSSVSSYQNQLQQKFEQKSNNNLDSINSQVEHNSNNYDLNTLLTIQQNTANNSNNQTPIIHVSQSQNPSITNFDAIQSDQKQEDINQATSPKNKVNSFEHFDAADTINRNSHEELDKKSCPKNRIVSANHLQERVIENEKINSNKQLNSPQKQQQFLQSPDNRLNQIDNSNNYLYIQNNSASKNPSQNEIQNSDTKRTNTFQTDQLLTEVKSLMAIMRSHTQLYKEIINEYHNTNKLQSQKTDLSKKYSYRFNNNEAQPFYKLDLKQSMKQSLKNVMLYTSKDNRDASFQQIETDLYQKFQQTLNNYARVDINNNSINNNINNKNLVNFMNSQQYQHPSSPQPQSLSSKYMLDKSKMNNDNRNGFQSQPQTPLSFQSEDKRAQFQQQMYQNLSSFSNRNDINQYPSSYQGSPLQLQQHMQISQQSIQQHQQSIHHPQQTVQQEQVLGEQNDYQNQHQKQKELGQFIIQPQKSHHMRGQTQVVRVPSRERNEFFGSHIENNSQYNQSNNYSHLNSSRDNNPSQNIPSFIGGIQQNSLKPQEMNISSQKQGSYRVVGLQQAPNRSLQNIYSLENMLAKQANQNISQQTQDLNKQNDKDEVESPLRIPNQKGLQSNKLASNQINGIQKDFNQQKKHFYIDNQKIY